MMSDGTASCTGLQRGPRACASDVQDVQAFLLLFLNSGSPSLFSSLCAAKITVLFGHSSFVAVPLNTKR